MKYENTFSILQSMAVYEKTVFEAEINILHRNNIAQLYF